MKSLLSPQTVPTLVTIIRGGEGRSGGKVRRERDSSCQSHTDSTKGILPKGREGRWPRQGEGGMMAKKSNRRDYQLCNFYMYNGLIGFIFRSTKTAGVCSMGQSPTPVILLCWGPIHSPLSVH